MKKHFLGSVAFIAWGISVPAMAADMPVKAPRVAPVPYFNWSGCYVGGHVGGGWGRKEFSDPTGSNFAPLGEAIGVKVSGFIGGGQIGCDYQFAPNWIAGLDADFSFANIKGSVVDPFFDNKNLHARTHWLASATGRLGYTMDRTMIYAKGGAAWARDRYDITAPGFLSFPGSDFTATETRSGWTVGFGFERAIWDNWSVKVEYDHYELGNRKVTLVDPSGGLDANIRQRIDAVKVGLNYRFGAPAFVPPRY